MAVAAPEAPVLLVTTKVDVASDAVVKELRGRGTPFVRLNTEDYPYRTGSTIAFNSGSSEPHVKVRNYDGPFRSIWWRRVRSTEVPEDMHPDVHDYCAREAKDFLIGATLLSCSRKMSHPENVWRAEHKLYQLTEAKCCGLAIPDTVVTNVPDDIRDAYRAFSGKMIAKPVRSGYVPVDGDEKVIYTSVVPPGHLEDLADATLSPTIFQRLLPKKADIRVTVVGTQIFSVAIDSQTDPAASIDWRRTQDPDLPHDIINLPRELEGKILRLTKRLGLEFGALDFVLTPQGEFVFLEINPSGQWLWLDDKLDLGISGAIAAWLSTPSESDAL